MALEIRAVELHCVLQISVRSPANDRPQEINGSAQLWSKRFVPINYVFQSKSQGLGLTKAKTNNQSSGVCGKIENASNGSSPKSLGSDLECFACGICDVQNIGI